MLNLFSLTCAMIAVTSAVIVRPVDAHHHTTEGAGRVHSRGRVYDRANPTTSLPFVVVADLDDESKDANSTKPAFFSYLQHGSLNIWKNDEKDIGDVFEVRWGQKQRTTSSINDADRGFELSELTWYHNQLLTVDDRTGIVFALTGFASKDSPPLQAIPQNIVMEGNGVSSKGQKHEWATVKDDALYLGSSGVTITDKDGKVDTAREWVAVLNGTNDVRHVKWTSNYERVRKALGVKDPGYVTHEAVEWSSIHKKWFLLPRRVSTEPFDEKKDSYRSGNKLIIASEDFAKVDVVEIGDKLTPERGYASFKFVPNTQDRVLLATKSVEVEGEQNAYVTLFQIDGTVLLHDVEIPGDSKYEGLAFTQH